MRLRFELVTAMARRFPERIFDISGARISKPTWMSWFFRPMNMSGVALYGMSCMSTLAL